MCITKERPCKICSDRMYIYASDGVVAWGYVLYVERVQIVLLHGGCYYVWDGFVSVIDVT